MSVDLNMNILIVDDYTAMAKVIKKFLEQFGFSNIDEATDGVMAMEKFNKKEYGLIISDWNMEPMDGHELLKKIRDAEEPHEEVPFIIMTAEGQTDNVIAAKQAGVSNYLAKPFDADTFREKVYAVLGDF